jgi:hypothetical protein
VCVTIARAGGVDHTMALCDRAGLSSTLDGQGGVRD